MHPDAVQTLRKWSSKTLAISPASLLTPHRLTFSKSTRHSQKAKTAPQLVDEVLADLEKLRARSRVLRSSSAAMEGSGDKETMEREIFDDTDFYQGLLRDLINSRTGSGVGEEDWMGERKQKKKKREVDTKASKGRKLRSVNEILFWL
jgi:protein AATF/BFR2